MANRKRCPSCQLPPDMIRELLIDLWVAQAEDRDGGLHPPEYPSSARAALLQLEDYLREEGIIDPSGHPVDDPYPSPENA